MKNFALKLAYDGTAYLGWQATKKGPSIEEELKKALETILQCPIRLQATSRTDRGVHAWGQIANFMVEKIELLPAQIHRRLNRLLPQAISVLELWEAPSNFHPTLDCQGKEYHYFICNTPIQLPQYRLYSWHCHHDLDLGLMKEAASLLIGEHDFSAFCNVKKNANYSTMIRKLTKIELVSFSSQRLNIQIAGNHFLYKMVRNLVGTIVYIGNRKLPLNTLQTILTSKDRTLAGVTAPAHGLFLQKVFYTENT